MHGNDIMPLHVDLTLLSEPYRDSVAKDVTVQINYNSDKNIINVLATTVWGISNKRHLETLYERNMGDPISWFTGHTIPP
jgi:hypothetical protein